MKTLNGGKNPLDMINRDNNSSDSGIDEDEEYHDSLEDIETVFRPEETVDSSMGTSSASANELDPWEYWDPTSDSYKCKRSGRNASQRCRKKKFRANP